MAGPPAAGSIPAAHGSAPGFPGFSAEGVAPSGKTAAVTVTYHCGSSLSIWHARAKSARGYSRVRR
jgi:hypothetical protein